MACHHGVEGHCIVCERVAYLKANPRPVEIVLLHIQGDSKSLCGLEPDQCLFSTTTAHDEERFCRQCLRTQRLNDKRAAEKARRAWKKLPRKVRLAHWLQAFREPDIYSLGFMVFFIWGLAIVALMALVVLGFVYGGVWYGVAAIALISVFLAGDRPPPRGRL